jgi:hypothetical protein
MNQTSVRTTMACIKNAMVFGADILTSKGKIGSLRNSSVLLSIRVGVENFWFHNSHFL